MASCKKTYDVLFHCLNLRNLSTVCKALESKSLNNRDILLEGTQKLARTEEMFELQSFELWEAIYESFFKEFSRCQKVILNKGEVRIKGSRIMKNQL